MNKKFPNWNIARYNFYSLFYNQIVKIFKTSRKKSINNLNIKSGQKVLIIGAGTGLDLEFIPAGAEIFLIDISSEMLKRINKDYYINQFPVFEIKIENAENLSYENEKFDVVIAHLILAVVPNPDLCISEIYRVMKPQGVLGVFDKFISPGTQISFIRKLINQLTNFLFSDITRDFYKINNNLFTVISDEKANFNGNFRIIKAIKNV